MSQGTGSRALELAALRAEQERLAGISIAIAAVEGDGSDHCIECGADISPARREAMPSACRCVGCQYDYERGWK